jgi:hypothetical protein
MQPLKDIFNFSVVVKHTSGGDSVEVLGTYFTVILKVRAIKLSSV